MSFWGTFTAIAETSLNVIGAASQLAPTGGSRQGTAQNSPRKPCGGGPILKGRNCPKVKARKQLFAQEK